MTKKEMAHGLWEQFAGINSIFSVAMGVIKLKRSVKRKKLKEAQNHFNLAAKNSMVFHNFIKEKGLIDELLEYEKEINEELKKVVATNMNKVLK